MTDSPLSPCLFDAVCQTSGGTFLITMRELTTVGCSAIAPAEWEEDFEFIRLTITGRAQINGRVVSRAGRNAEIRFFGQINPRAIEGWMLAAA